MGHYKKLKAWEHARALALISKPLIDRLPSTERSNLADQWRRAASSVVLNIAEGASRRGPREFRKYLDTARASLDEIEAIIDLAVPDSELIHRMEDRRVCSKCGWNAEPGSAPNETCARCGGRMIMRADDGDQAVRQHRLEVYARESWPLLDYYRSRPTFRSINGAQAPEKVAAELSKAIDQMIPAAVRAGARDAR